MIKKLISILLVFSLMGCTSPRQLMRPTPRSVDRRIDVGDSIEVVAKDRRIWKMKVLSINDEIISGRSEGQDVSIAIADIDEIRYRGVSVVKTAGLAGAEVIVVVVTVLVAIGIAISHGFLYIGPTGG